VECKYFGKCGSCVSYETGYEGQLQQKAQLNRERFLPFYQNDIALFASEDGAYRARAEFRIWHMGEAISYAMHAKELKQYLPIESCPQVDAYIAALMPKLLDAVEAHGIKEKLFGADFLCASSGESVITLLYHKKLGDEWQAKASKIAQELGCSLIGRSKKQKLVIGKDHVIESLNIDKKSYRYMQIENSFTQPNRGVNEKMIGWVLQHTSGIGGDLLELYCGAGNFTIPFAGVFHDILATEISKTSIAAAMENMRLNGVENIAFLRMSVEELVEALDKGRVFRRMQGIVLEDYDINTVFVDPPRAGMDEFSCRFISRYEHIVYISCNPQTLLRDLEILSQTHTVEAIALFDQFPYTHHVEMGVKLKKRA
jgi:tRNA (uracil-5-)-methyltransferase